MTHVDIRYCINCEISLAQLYRVIEFVIRNIGVSFFCAAHRTTAGMNGNVILGMKETFN